MIFMGIEWPDGWEEIGVDFSNLYYTEGARWFRLAEQRQFKVRKLRFGARVYSVTVGKFATFEERMRHSKDSYKHIGVYATPEEALAACLFYDGR